MMKHARWIALGWALGLTPACGPQTPAPPPPSGEVCATPEGCAAAIVAAEPAELAALVKTYAERHAPGWDRVFAAMDDDQAVIGETVPWPGDPKVVSADDLLLALGRAKNRPHLVVAGKRPRILFPRDSLGSVLGFADAVLAVDPQQREADLALVRGVDETIAHADAFDYVSAAEGADALHDALLAPGGSREIRWRARMALDVLRNTSVALETPEGRELPELPPVVPGSSPYADLLAHRLFGGEDAHWRSRQQAILSGVPEDRRAAVRQYFAPVACPDPFVPPMDRLSDLIFAARYAAALDREAAPGAEPAAGKLALPDWRAGYERMVELVESSHPWMQVSFLLTQRGELDGMSAASSATYKRVSALGKKHIEALRKLVAAHPARFDVLGLMPLFYQPGALADPMLRQALATLVRDVVKQKLAVADDPSELFEDALVAFMTATSLPGPIQAAQLTALREALDQKLGGDFGRRPGWPVAALHAGHAVTGLLFGDPAWLQRAAARIDRSLEGELPYPQLAALVRAGTNYAELSVGGTLDADVLNPVQFPLVRTEARRKLQAAIEGLAGSGPQGGKEKALARLVADMTDGLIALAAAQLSRDEDDGPQCENAQAVPHQASWQRMRQRQKRLLRDPVFSGKGDGPWARRARLLALLVSDMTDLLAPDGETATVPGARAETVAREGLQGWIEGPVAETSTAGYLVVRRLAGGELDSERILQQSVTLLSGLSQLFEEEGQGLFGTLAAIGKDVETSPAQGDLAALFAAYADRAYEAQADAQGDLLLLLALSVNLSRESPMAPAAVETARNHDRPVLLPLLMYDRKMGAAVDPAPLLAAMKRAGQKGCAPPDPAMVIAVRRAIYDFRHGEREDALRRLDRVVADATRKGLVVPRQTYSYLQRAGTRYLKAVQSVSLGEHLLEESGTFNVGLGYVSGGPEGGELDVELMGASTPEALKEAARYYAHAAALSAAYHFALSEDAQAIAAARTAVGAWANGVKLGDERVPVGAETARWAKDATGTIAVVAQRTAEQGHALLAGDLWTLARASLDPEAKDEDIAAILDPAPAPLRNVPELAPVIVRARESLKLVAAPLACTGAEVDVSAYAKVDCETYPAALALRVADALPKLPRLKKSAETGHPRCIAWRKVDLFLEAVDAGRYEPVAFEAAVASLRQTDRQQDAATMMARQRHPKHCTPGIVDQARELAKKKSLGLHLRADVLSVAANCARATPAVDKDLLALDELTQQHANPTRNFELMIFAARLALAGGRYEPLYRLTHQPGFLRRYQRLGPDLTAAALLLFHASAAGAGKPSQADETAASRRLVCSTFAEPRRATMCNVIGQLTDEKTANPPAVAKDALQRFVEEALRPGGS